MSSPVEICNTALGRIGISEQINDFTEQNNRARQCNLLYEPTRDQLLEDYPWDFAQTVTALAVTSTTVELGYGYRYGLPADCLRAQVVTDVAGARWPGAGIGIGLWNYAIRFGRTGRIPFQIMADRDAPPARILMTDIPEAYLWYTMRVEDPNAFSALFRSALAWKLAGELALALKSDADTAQWASEMVTTEVSKAEVLSASQASRDSYMPESESVTARLC